MKNLALSTLAFAAGTHALVSRGSSCCFHLSATGGPGGEVCQLGDGQNRIGDDSLPPGDYCINSNGAITDSQGRSCNLTPPTTQLQCDVGATPYPGFTVGCNGNLMANGSSNFFACPTGDNGGYNIYTETLNNEPGCVNITLTSDGCQSGCPKPTPTPSPSPSPAPAPTCPGELTGAWEFPHLIIPIDSANPNEAYGSSYNGTISETVSSIYNFDIPVSDNGKTCSLVFYFPEQAQLQTSAYDFSGPGSVGVSILKTAANTGTTYANAPAVANGAMEVDFMPGTATTMFTFPCPGNTQIGVRVDSKSGTCLSYFQDYNPCPIGMYITAA